MSGNGEDKRLIYIIMADFGTAYGWTKDNGAIDKYGVEGCHADSVGWFGEHEIPEELHKEFVEWQDPFESSSVYEEDGAAKFPWEEFNKQGLALCRKLKAALGDEVRVCYEKACEDKPYADEHERQEILLDGSIVGWKLTR